MSDKLRPPSGVVWVPTRHGMTHSFALLGLRVQVDPTLEPGTLVLRGARGSEARIVNIAVEPKLQR